MGNTNTATSPATDDVILVDEADRAIGTAPKLDAHQNGGRLHRAFSVFIFDSAGRMLLQRRAPGKYHFGGLWTNACCSHPRPGPSLVGCARARLQHELGIDVPLEERFSIVYRAEDPASGLTEHEFDHVLVGRFDGRPQPNADEVDAWEWVEPAALLDDVRRRPERYTPWFRLVLERVIGDASRLHSTR